MRRVLDSLSFLVEGESMLNPAQIFLPCVLEWSKNSVVHVDTLYRTCYLHAMLHFLLPLSVALQLYALCKGLIQKNSRLYIYVLTPLQVRQG
jgi:hypothetical protein